VCEKEETTGEDVCGSKKRKNGYSKKSPTNKNTHTHQFVTYIPILHTTVYIKGMYLCVYICMYVCIIMLGSLNKCCQRNLWSQFFLLPFFKGTSLVVQLRRKNHIRGYGLR
jgi:hypothetical protein